MKHPNCFIHDFQYTEVKETICPQKFQNWIAEKNAKRMQYNWQARDPGSKPVNYVPVGSFLHCLHWQKMDTCSSAWLPFYKFPYPESVLHGGWQRKSTKTGSKGDITRIPRLELFSILKVLFPHRTIERKSGTTYVLNFTDSKKVFWLNPMIYDLGILCFMPSSF